MNERINGMPDYVRAAVTAPSYPAAEANDADQLNLQNIDARGAAVFTRQIAEAPVGRKYKDVDYWREGLAKLLARSAAVASTDKPLEVRK